LTRVGRERFAVDLALTGFVRAYLIPLFMST